MAFYENNIQRIRNDLKHLLTDDDFKNFMPCSKKSMCTIKDMISSESPDSDLDKIDLIQEVEEAEEVEEGEAKEVEEVKVEEEEVKEVKEEEEVKVEEVKEEEVKEEEVKEEEVKEEEVKEVKVEEVKEVEEEEVEEVKEENSKCKNRNIEELKITLPPMDDTDEESGLDYNSDSNTEDSDVENFKEIDIDIDDSDYETELDIIRENETKLKKLKTNYFSNETVPISYEDDDDFVNNLIRRELEDKTFVNYNNRPYKVEINSAEPESEGGYSDEETEKICDKKYNNFEAFYENYITNNKDFEQLKVFNKIIANNLATMKITYVT